MRFHSAPVVRLADAKPVQLGHVARADGAWRLYVFADRPIRRARLAARPVRVPGARRSRRPRFTPAGADPDSVIDVRAVLQQGHRELAAEDLPRCCSRARARSGSSTTRRCSAPTRGRDDVFDLRGIDRDAGCLVVVRPDQYVAHVLPLDATGDLSAFLERSMRVR